MGNLLRVNILMCHACDHMAGRTARIILQGGARTVVEINNETTARRTHCGTPSTRTSRTCPTIQKPVLQKKRTCATNVAGKTRTCAAVCSKTSAVLKFLGTAKVARKTGNVQGKLRSEKFRPAPDAHANALLRGVPDSSEDPSSNCGARMLTNWPTLRLSTTFSHSTEIRSCGKCRQQPRSAPGSEDQKCPPLCVVNVFLRDRRRVCNELFRTQQIRNVLRSALGPAPRRHPSSPLA